MPWDERNALAAWERGDQLPTLPGIASRRGADGAAHSADAAAAAAAVPAPPPPLCVAPAGPVQELRFDGSPAWAALVPAAAARLQGHRGGGGGGGTAAAWPVARAPALYRGPRQLSCTYAFEWRCAGGTHRVADVAATGAVLESKVELALAALAAGAGVCPATFFLPWQTERLPSQLAAAFGPGTLWVLKRDALSNGEGVFFVATPAEAEEVIASQRATSYLTMLSHGGDVSDFVLQRHVDAPLLMQGRKFHLRAYVAVWPAAPGDSAAQRCTGAALWGGVEVRLAARPYSGDVADKLQMLTNFAPNAGAAGDAIKRMASEFSAPLEAACPAWQDRLAALAADTAALAEGELVPTAECAAVVDDAGVPWLGFALLALDVMVDSSGRLWLLEVNRGPAAGDESVDDTLQSGPYRAHMGQLADALLAAAAPPCGLPDGARGWPDGFVPLPQPQLAPAWPAPMRRQLRPLLRRLPPALQAAVALAAAGPGGAASPAVTRELARVAGPTRLADALTAHRDSAGRSAMHAAAELGLSHGVALLAALCPALANTPDAAGVTPLGLAARAGAVDAARALLDAGADADDDDTPLHHAAAADSAALVAALVSAGADVERATPSGTPLHWAAGEGAAHAAAALLRAGAAPDAADADGMPPLLLAVAGGAGAVVEALLAAGAQPAAAALPGGATVLHVAAEGGDRRCIAALLRCAAGREMCAARDADGFSPRDVAEASGHEDVLPLFHAAS